MIEQSNRPTSTSTGADTAAPYHLGFATVAGYPATIAGFIDPRFPGPDIVSLLISPNAGIYATDSGRITVSTLTLDDWLKFDNRRRLLQEIERAAFRAGLELNTFEGLNVLVWLIERRIGHEQNEAIAQSVPGVVAAYRELVKHVGEQADTGSSKMH